MRRLLVLYFLLCSCVYALAQVGQILPPPQLNVHVSGGGCSQNIALQARMDGGQNASAVQTLICTGLVGNAQGNLYAALGGLWMFATNSTTNALLDWSANANNGTAHGTLTFSANNGYTGDGSTGYISTAANPHSSSQWSLNTAAMGVCTLSSRTANQNWTGIGTSDATNYSFIEALSTGIDGGVNDATTEHISGISNARGANYLAREGSSTTVIGYQNGSNVGSTSVSSTAIPNTVFYLMALNYNGATSFFNADQVAYVFFTNGITSDAVAAAYYNAFHTYLQTIGETTAC